MSRNEVLLPQSIFERIVNDLLIMEENKEDVLSMFSHSTEQRHSVGQLVDGYIERTEAFLLDVAVDKDNVSETVVLPFVLVGSTVEVLEKASGEIQSFRISHPFSKSSSFGSTSYISPVGLGLLSQKQGHTAAIETPGGGLNFYINKIQISPEALL